MTLHPERPAAAGSTAGSAHQPRYARLVTLPSAPRAAGLARLEVRDALTLLGLERLEDTAVLLASELVGNAVRHAHHGGTEMELRIADTGAWLRIEVADADPRPPQPHFPAGLDESGFGLVLVDALAVKWGVEQTAAGKTVWIELDTGRARQPGSPSRRGPAASHRDGAERCQAQPTDQPAGEISITASGDPEQSPGSGGIPAMETASLCRSAAALINKLGWDRSPRPGTRPDRCP